MKVRVHTFALITVGESVETYSSFCLPELFQHMLTQGRAKPGKTTSVRGSGGIFGEGRGVCFHRTRLAMPG